MTHKRRPEKEKSIRASSFCDRTANGVWLVLLDFDVKRVVVVPLRDIHKDVKIVMIEHGKGPLWYIFGSADEANSSAVKIAKEEGWEAVTTPRFKKP